MGRAAARELFGEGFDPVGERITIGGQSFAVSGYFRTSDADMDETVFVPLAAGQSMLKARHLQTITVADRTGGRCQPHRRSDHDAVARAPWARPAGGQRRRASAAISCPASAASSVDDFTVKTQAAANVTKGLYTSVAAFALANMPKLDEITLQEMSSTLEPRRFDDDGSARQHCRRSR